MPAIQYVTTGTNSQNSVSGNPVDVIIPGNAANGDLLLALGSISFAPNGGPYSVTLPGGWSWLIAPRAAGSGGNSNLTWFVAYKFCSGDQNTTVQFQNNALNQTKAGRCVVYRNVRTSSPFSGVNINGTATTASNVMPSNTAHADNAWALAVGADYASGGAGTYSATGFIDRGPAVGFAAQNVGVMDQGGGTPNGQARGNLTMTYSGGERDSQRALLFMAPVNDAPGTPTNVTPSGAISTVKPMLRATVSDPEGGSVYAQFQVATDSGFTNVVTSPNGSTVASGTTSEVRCPIDLNSSTTYYVRARAVDNQGVAGSYSGGVAFSTPAAITSQFTFTGGQQTFVVPSGVTSLTVEAYGAQGGGGNGVTGGLGGYARGTIAVTPGETLYIQVGGTNNTSNGEGGYNGGGRAGFAGYPGGGGTDLRRGGTALGNRVIAAGGGGGGGAYTSGTYNGGGGGGTNGIDGQNQTYGGKGGTQTSGGARGANYRENATLDSYPAAGLGQGGGNSDGGGGGGGYYGGGAGGYEDAFGGTAPGYGHSGGGGSSLVNGSNTATTAAQRSGTGLLVVSYPRYDETANSAPGTPTLVAPAAGAIIPKKPGQFFDWTHSDPNGDAQNAYALRLTTGSSNYWWNGSGWNTSETFVSSATDSATVDPSGIPAGSYTWAVATTDGKGGTSPYSGTRTFTLNSAPNAPLLNSPVENAAPDLASGVRFDWSHSDPENDAQSGWQFRRAVKTATPTYEFYNVGTAAWQSTPVTNSGSVDEYTFPAGKWSAGTTYLWSVATQDGGSTLVGPFAADRTVAAQAPPAAPTLVSPVNSGYADLAAGFTFDWTFSDPNPGDTQGSWAMRRKISGAASYEFYNVGTAAWQTTEVYNTGTTDGYTFPSGKWTSGTVYNWSVAVKDQGGNTSPYASDFTVTASTPPSVTVTAPSGSVSGTTRPAVTWTYTDTQNDPQSAFQVKVFTEAQYNAAGFSPATSAPTVDSGVVNASASRSYQLQTDLTVGVNYRAYVQVTQVGGQTSPWAFSGFVLTVNTPAIPDLAVIQQTAQGRVQLSITTTDNLLSADNASMEASAGNWGGNNGTVARTTDASLNGAASLLFTSNLAGTTGIGPFVRVGPLQQGRTYTAIASLRKRTGTGAQIVSAFVEGGSATGAPVTVTDTGWVQAVVTFVAGADVNPALTLYTVTGSTIAVGDAFYVDAVKIAPGSSTQFSRGGLAGIVDVLVERSEDSGASWTTVRGTPVRINGQDQRVTVFDYEAKPQGTVLYRARSSAEV